MLVSVGAVGLGEEGEALVFDGALVVEVSVLEDVSEGGLAAPVLALALSWKAEAVWSPDRGGLTESTIPDLQSVLAEEKNQSGLVSFTCGRCRPMCLHRSGRTRTCRS